MCMLPKNVRIDDNNLWVELHDGRTLGVPLAWFPRLLAATLKHILLNETAAMKQIKTRSPPQLGAGFYSASSAFI